MTAAQSPSFHSEIQTPEDWTDPKATWNTFGVHNDKALVALLCVILLSLAVQADPYFRTFRKTIIARLSEKRVQVIRWSGPVKIPLSAIKTGDVLRLRQGNVVPLDGILIWAPERASQSVVFKEPSPAGPTLIVKKYPGQVLSEGNKSFVMAGSRVHRGYGYLRVINAKTPEARTDIERSEEAPLGPATSQEVEDGRAHAAGHVRMSSISAQTPTINSKTRKSRRRLRPRREIATDVSQPANDNTKGNFPPVVPADSTTKLGTDAAQNAGKETGLYSAQEPRDSIVVDAVDPTVSLNHDSCAISLNKVLDPESLAGRRQQGDQTCHNKRRSSTGCKSALGTHTSDLNVDVPDEEVTPEDMATPHHNENIKAGSQHSEIAVPTRHLPPVTKSSTCSSALPSPPHRVSRQRALRVFGDLEGIPAQGVPDFGSSFDIISLKFLKKVLKRMGRRWVPPHDGDKPPYALPDGKVKSFLGTITLMWHFEGESQPWSRQFYILEDSIYPLLFGRQFLNDTKVFTKSRDRIREVMINVNPAIKRVLYVDQMGAIAASPERILGLINGKPIYGFADTCSDIPIIKRNIAHKLGFEVLDGPEHTTEVQFIDGSTSFTTGVVKNVNWCFGVSQAPEDTRAIHDLHVMDHIPCAMILDTWLLWDSEAFDRYRQDFRYDVYFHHPPQPQPQQPNPGAVCAIKVVDKAVPSPDANETPEAKAAYELNLAADEEEEREGRLQWDRMVAAAQQRQGNAVPQMNPAVGASNSTQTNAVVQVGAQANPSEGLGKKARRKMRRTFTWMKRQDGGP